MEAERVLLALIRKAVCDGWLDAEIKKACCPEMLESVYKLAQKHDLAHLVAHALEDVQLQPCEALTKLKKSKMQAIYRFARLSYEFEIICDALENAGIPFVPLKGSVLRNFYAEPWMRTSCDIDILVKEEQLEQALSLLTTALGYQIGERGNHDVALAAPSGVHVELHFDLVQSRYAEDRSRAVLRKVWLLAKPVTEGGCRRCMPDELFYYYHIAHMAKHVAIGGCGIRTVLDVWIMNHRMPDNERRRDDLLKIGGLKVFAKTVEKLSQMWFSGEQGDALTEQLSRYILSGGVFGNMQNRAAFGQAKSGGKGKYLLTRRLFLPYHHLKAEYPILIKHKWLFPAFQVVRWIQMILSGAARRHIRELWVNSGISRREAETVGNMLRDLGI